MLLPAAVVVVIFSTFLDPLSAPSRVMFLYILELNSGGEM